MLELKGCLPFTRSANDANLRACLSEQLTKWSERGVEKVKLYELQYETKWSVLGGRG